MKKLTVPGNVLITAELPELYDYLLKFILIGTRCSTLERCWRTDEHDMWGSSAGGGGTGWMLMEGSFAPAGAGGECPGFLNRGSRRTSRDAGLPSTPAHLASPLPAEQAIRAWASRVEFASTLMRLPSSTPAASIAGGRIRNSKTLKVQCWDTAGQERFRSVTRNYYRGACGAVIVYDITSRRSFENLSSWLADARALASPDLAVVIVGNKADRPEDDRQVPYLEASRWAQERGALFVEASSKTGENVEQPFILLARSILLAIESGTLDPDAAGSGVSYGSRELRRLEQQRGCWCVGAAGLVWGEMLLIEDEDGR
ncbi:SPOSA6832_01037, partial [Sporobolomyces salmonicolor]